MIFKKARCALILGLVLATHLLILFYVNDYNSDTVALDFSSDSPFITKLQMLFNAKFMVPWKNQQLEHEDQQRMYLLSTDLKDINNEIKLPKAYLEIDSEDTINKHIVNYDPRLTTGLILSYLTKTLQYDKSLDNLEIPFFHWSDYVDLSMLHEYQIKPDKAQCSQFKVESKYNRKPDVVSPETFCLQDDQFEFLLNSPDTSEYVKKRIRQIQASPINAGFHVWQNGGRSTKANKILEAKSYLHDFMPPPLSMVLLLPPELNQFKGMKSLNNAIKIKVNQDNYKKLIESSLLKSYSKEKNLRDIENPQMGGEIQENVEDLIINVKQDFDDFLSVLSTINYQTVSEIPFEKHLIHEQFIDNSTEILKSLKDSQDIHLQNYKQGLELSLNTPSPPKYFSEARLLKGESHSELGAHHDWRFFNGLINFTKNQPVVLHGIIKAWFQFINNYNINSWIAHGSLLSWYWNGLAFPWDIDFDVQMPIQDLHYMCKNFNQTLVMDLGNEFGSNEIRYSRYFLDCGTFISHRKRENGNNNIDARFVDVSTGVYIDITALAVTDTDSPARYDERLPDKLSKLSKDQTIGHYIRNDFLKVYNCRNNHFQTIGDLSPLKLSFYEGQLNYIPRDYRTLLVNEYKEDSLNASKYKTYTYVSKFKLWVETNSMIKFIKTKYPSLAPHLRVYKANNNLGSRNPNRLITEEFKTDEDYIEFLMENKDILFEFLITDQITQFHKQQIQKLDKSQTTKQLMFTEDSLSRTFNPIRHDYFNYRSFMDGYNFISENEKLTENIKSWAQPSDSEPKSAEPESEPSEAEIEEQKQKELKLYLEGKGIEIEEQPEVIDPTKVRTTPSQP